MLCETCDELSSPRPASRVGRRGSSGTADAKSGTRVLARISSSAECSTGGGGRPSHPHPVSARPARQQRRDALTHPQVEKFLCAIKHARIIGLPLNRFFTINWEAAGATEPVRATGRFLKLARDWLRRQGSASAHVWVQECGLIVGQHAHILMHISPSLARAFSCHQRGWLSACGATFQAGIIKSRPVGHSYTHALVGIQHGERYQVHLAAATQYMLKESEAEAKRRFKLTVASKGGSTRGKRIATSQNIGSAARCASRGSNAADPFSRGDHAEWPLNPNPTPTGYSS